MKTFRQFITELSRDKLNDYRSKAMKTLDTANDKDLVKRNKGATLANKKICKK